ncbi:SGNH/GDSL hydrolase family protein [Desmospora profundinema]|uniref:Lysophospholipase L1-like esterase n=1 Tax=Desmospora profundinema TaxID=1571184 RepID=A0ABU1IIU6_9BACL|nr:SGNH/GDSL hydrolase family protein [Desmospora profundinema]MDR6224681.1 lysophospholipase L1-like esterase [Desmospora profundinema]
MRHSPSLYLAIGDSITVGVAASPGRGYAKLVTGTLARAGPAWTLSRAARKGATSKEALFWTVFSPRVRLLIRYARVITLLIGGNDLLYAYLASRFTRRPLILSSAVAAYRRNLHLILYQIRHHSPAPVFLLNQYNPFPRSTFATAWVDAFNSQTADTADRWGIPLINLHELFTGRETGWIDGYRNGSLSDIPLIGPKPIHPNNAGHQAIADAVAATVLHE